MKFDDILTEIGECGCYQKWLVFLLFLPCFFAAMQDLGYVFTSGIPSHRCYVNGCDNDTTTYEEDFLNLTTPFDNSNGRFSQCQLFKIANVSNYDRCSIDKLNLTSTYNCDLWKYDTSVYTSTVVTQFNLVCDNENLAALAQSVYMAGGMFGGIVTGMAADKYGRKKTLLICILMTLAMGVASAVIPNYLLYLVLRFIMGGNIHGIFLIAFVMCVEFVGKNYRGYTGSFASAFYSLGEATFGGIAYAIRDWQHLQLTISAPFVSFLIYLWIVPESPRWLLVNGKVNEAEQTLLKIANSNSKKFSREMLFDFQADDETMKNTTEVEKVSWLDLFRTPYLRLMTVVLCIIMFVICMTFFGISIVAPSLGGNRYINSIISSVVQIPADVVGLLLINKIGRRYSLCLSLISGGITGICMAFIPNSGYHWLRITLATVFKFGAGDSYTIIYVFAAELYPTALRNTGIAITSFIGLFGSVFAPYVAQLVTVNVYLPMVIFGVCSLIAGLMSLTLPETMGKRLPETVKDCEDTPVIWCCPKRANAHQDGQVSANIESG